MNHSRGQNVKTRLLCIIALLFAGMAHAASLPGFRVERIAALAGFPSSLAVDSRGVLYYTTTSGDVFRVDGTNSIRVASVTTEAIGNSGLLGMALFDDRTAAVHYTTPAQTHDVVSRIDLITGAETILHSFVSDVSSPGSSVNIEHHGGNPTVAPDGSVFVGIGDLGTGALAQMSEWNAGKVFRIYPDGQATTFAHGLRNPYDLAWDHARQRLIVGDNGPKQGDEIHVLTATDDAGWPYTYGDQPAVAGTVPPRYVFAETVVPTGVAALTGRNAALNQGYLFGSFLGSIFWVRDIDALPAIRPLALIDEPERFVLDVAEGPSGDVFFIAMDGIYRLVLPRRGDCDGNGTLNNIDVTALQLELQDGGDQSVLDAHGGAFRGSWGCDADGDSLITATDVTAMGRLLHPRVRAVRSLR